MSEDERDAAPPENGETVKGEPVDDATMKGEKPSGEGATAVAPRAASRRRFTKALAAAVVAAPVATAIAAAQTAPAAREPKAPPNPQPTPSPQTPPQPSPLAEAYAQVARERFGAHTTPEEFARVKRDLEGNVRTADRLRAAKLKNSDEPDFVFEA
jgi:glucose/arabinose dehydrogenase